MPWSSPATKGWNTSGWSAVAAAGGYSANATQFFSRITDPGTTRKNLYAAMIDGLTSDGVWSTLDCLYILAADISGNALVNLKSSSFSPLSAVNTPTFTADVGYAGNGSSSYLSSTYIPSTAGGNLTQNSATIFGYTTSTRVVAANKFLVGSANAGFTNILSIDPFSGGTGLEVSLNDAQITYSSPGAAKGSWVATRTGASAGLIRKNAGVYATVAATSSGLPDQAMLIGVLNQGGSPAGGTFSDDPINAVGWGAQLSSTALMDALSNRVNTYMAGLPTPINIY